MVNQRNRDQSARRLVKTILESRTAVAGNTEPFEVLFCDEVPLRDRERRLKLIRVHLTRLASRQRGLIFELQDIEAHEAELGIVDEVATELEQLLFGLEDLSKPPMQGSEIQKKDSRLTAAKFKTLSPTQNVSLVTFCRKEVERFKLVLQTVQNGWRAIRAPCWGKARDREEKKFWCITGHLDPKYLALFKGVTIWEMVMPSCDDLSEQAEKRLSLCNTLPTSLAIARLFLNNMKRKAEIFRILLELDVKFASSVMTQLEVKRIKGNPFLEFFTRDTVEAKLWWPLVRIVLKETEELVHKTGSSKLRGVYQTGVSSIGKKQEQKLETSVMADKLAKKRKNTHTYKKAEKVSTHKQLTLRPLAPGNDLRNVPPRSRFKETPQNDLLKPSSAQPWAPRAENLRRLLPQPFSLDSLSTKSGSSSGPAGVAEEAPNDTAFKRETSQEDIEGPYSENSTTETLTRSSKGEQQTATHSPSKRSIMQYNDVSQGSNTLSFSSEGHTTQEYEVNRRISSRIPLVASFSNSKMCSVAYSKGAKEKEIYAVGKEDSGNFSEDMETETNDRGHGLNEAGPGAKALYQVIAPYECCTQDEAFSHSPYRLARGPVQPVENNNAISEYNVSLNEPYRYKDYSSKGTSDCSRGGSGGYEAERGKELLFDETFYSQATASIPRLTLSQDKDWAWSTTQDNLGSGAMRREGTNSTVYVSNEKVLGKQTVAEVQQPYYTLADTSIPNQETSFTEPPYGYHRQGAMEFSQSLLHDSDVSNSAEDTSCTRISVGRMAAKSSVEHSPLGARVSHQAVSPTVQAANPSNTHAALNTAGLPMNSLVYNIVAPDSEGDHWHSRSTNPYASPMAPFGWTSNLGASLQAARRYTESPGLLNDTLVSGRIMSDPQDHVYFGTRPVRRANVANGPLPAGHPPCHPSQGRQPVVGDPSHNLLYSAASPLYGQQNYLSSYLTASWTPQTAYPKLGGGGSFSLKGPVEHKKPLFHKTQRRTRTITDQGIEGRKKDEAKPLSSDEERGEDQSKTKNMFLSWFDKVTDGFQSTKQRPKFYCT